MFSLHIGTFLIFSAMALLIVASISAPTFSQIDFLSASSNNGASIRFGTFGFCVLDGRGGKSCTAAQIGYRIANEISALGISPLSGGQASTLHGATQALILHPIAAGIAGIAFLLALCSHRLGYIVAAFVAFIAFIVSLAAMIVDWVIFGIVRHHVNSNGGQASFENAIWMVLVATIVLLLASITTCFACVTARRRSSTRTTYGGNY